MAKIKKDRFSHLGKRTQTTSKGLADKDRTRERKQRQEKEALFFPLRQIMPRPGGDTRPLNPEHILFLAESIQALGLLEPVVVDKQGQLLAGGHRVAACQLLSLPSNLREDFLRSQTDFPAGKQGEQLLAQLQTLPELEEALEEIPIRKFDFRAEDDLERALSIEAAENTQRRDYTPNEVKSIYEKLLASGYSDQRGRPKQGENPAKPMIASVIGRSVRTVERLLSKADKQIDETDELKKAVKAVERSIQKLSAIVQRSEQHDGSPLHELAQRLNHKKLQQLLKKALDDPESL